MGALDVAATLVPSDTLLQVLIIDGPVLRAPGVAAWKTRGWGLDYHRGLQHPRPSIIPAPQALPPGTLPVRARPGSCGLASQCPGSPAQLVPNCQGLCQCRFSASPGRLGLHSGSAPPFMNKSQAPGLQASQGLAATTHPPSRTQRC